MFAKIKEWKIDFISDKKVNPDMIELTSEECDKILKWFIYDNWEFKEVEKTTEQKISEINEKYSQIILSKYSLTDQANLTQEWLVIMWLKEFENRELTETEKSRLMELYSMRTWITEQRELCRIEKEELWN